MKICRFYRYILIGLLTVLVTNPLLASPDPAPILRQEQGRHFDSIWNIDVDRQERYAVTASNDKTLRVWDIRNNGKLLRTIRPPIGGGNEGLLYAVAISPDGKFIAVGGWSHGNGIYLFRRNDGHLVRRISDLPSSILDLTFSHDGRKLAVALWGKSGIRVFNPANGKLLGSDSDYGKRATSVDFDAKGRLVSSSYDGQVRLYDTAFRLRHRYRTQDGIRLKKALFSPDGRSIVLGFSNKIAVEILAAHDLSLKRKLDTSGVDGYIARVAWSQDGRWVYASGNYDDGNGYPLLKWSQKGGPPREFRAAQDRMMALHPLRDGSIIYASADPTLGRLDAVERASWRRTSGKLNFTGMRSKLKLSPDGRRVWFDFKYEGESNGQVIKGQTGWDVSTQSLLKAEPSDGQAPRLKAGRLKVSDWLSEYDPKLNGKLLPLRQYEVSLSLAITRDERSFALGTSWSLRYFEANGRQRWKKAVSSALAVNVSQNGRWVVAALGDGTIRWYEAHNEGKERLAFYLHADQKRWIAWTPEGFYATSSENAESLIGYHLNHGADRAAKFVKVDRLKKVYARADLVARALESGFPNLAKETLDRAGDVRRFLQAGRLPPKITVVGGKHEFNRKGGNFTLPIAIWNHGADIGRIEYRIAGKTFGDLSTRGSHKKDGDGLVRKNRSFTLPHGRTEMEVVAFSPDGNVQSDPVKVIVHMNHPVRKPASLHVLSIGVSDYEDDKNSLRFATGDAKAFAETLEKHVDPTIYKKVSTTVLLDREVTLHRIHKELIRISKVSRPQDVFVLYMAGHSLSLDGRYQFIPHNLRYSDDAALRQRGLSEEKLRDWLLPIKANKNLMVLDSCDTKTSNNPQIKQHNSNELEDKVAIGNLTKSTGFTVLTARSSKQQSSTNFVDRNTGKGQLLYKLSVDWVTDCGQVQE